MSQPCYTFTWERSHRTRGLPIARRNDYLGITHSSRVDGGLAKQLGTCRNLNLPQNASPVLKQLDY
jgi:hypothetical protein